MPNQQYQSNQLFPYQYQVNPLLYPHPLVIHQMYQQHQLSYQKYQDNQLVYRQQDRNKDNDNDKNKKLSIKTLFPGKKIKDLNEVEFKAYGAKMKETLRSKKNWAQVEEVQRQSHQKNSPPQPSSNLDLTVFFIILCRF